ncbi:putative uncharacterized protein [Firmicutes bacterium CAG:791]|nr:putative uncharacterized protein [Firmicutes bacterium CAG:791]
MTAGKVKEKHSINHKLTLLVAAAMLPFLCVAAYLLYALLSYGNAYDRVVRNMTMANSYNLSFKEEMDENLYKIVVSGTTFDEIPGSDSLENPYELLDELQGDFQELESITTDATSRRWLQNLLRNIDTLRERVDDIRLNLQESGHYDENIEMLDNNIYILTELIQDDIQYYIYYQTQSMEMMRASLNQQVFTFIVCMILLLAALTAFVAIIETRISRSISGPILGLSQVTHEIAQGDFSVRADEKGDRELGALAASVNNMAEHLSVMVMQIREDERKMRKAELRLLQEQINPHFLYNTLDAIVWMIEDGKSEQAENMVVSLSTFFRTVLSRGREFISIREEVQHIRSYLEIQKARYQDILSYEIQVAPELYPYEILKMTLQPLVENALYHGVKNKRSGGLIRISGERDGKLIRFKVEDDGIGMNAEALTHLQEEIRRPCKETDTGFGMANVNERIRMNFGADYGLMIESEEGKGTRVWVTIPAVLSENAKREEGAR